MVSASLLLLVLRYEELRSSCSRGCQSPFPDALPEAAATLCPAAQNPLPRQSQSLRMLLGATGNFMFTLHVSGFNLASNVAAVWILGTAGRDLAPAARGGKEPCRWSSLRLVGPGAGMSCWWSRRPGRCWVRGALQAGPGFCPMLHVFCAGALGRRQRLALGHQRRRWLVSEVTGIPFAG